MGCQGCLGVVTALGPMGKLWKFSEPEAEQRLLLLREKREGSGGEDVEVKKPCLPRAGRGTREQTQVARGDVAALKWFPAS